MAATEALKISPALERFLDEGSDDEYVSGHDSYHDDQEVAANVTLGQLDFTTTETSLKGRPYALACPCSVTRTQSQNMPSCLSMTVQSSAKHFTLNTLLATKLGLHACMSAICSRADISLYLCHF